MNKTVRLGKKVKDKFTEFWYGKRVPDRGSDPTLTTKEGNKSNGRVNASMEAMGNGPVNRSNGGKGNDRGNESGNGGNRNGLAKENYFLNPLVLIKSAQ